MRRTKYATVGFIQEAPTSFVSTDGVVTGVEPELFRAFAKTEGITTVTGTVSDFASMIPGLLAGRWDVIAAGMFVRPTRCTQVAFGDPDVEEGEALVTAKGNPLGLHSLSDIAANSQAIVGSITGGVETGFIQSAGIPSNRHILFQLTTEEIAAFESGRINVMFGPSLSLEQVLSGSPTLQSKAEYVTLSSQPAGAVGYTALGFRKADTDLVKAYDAWRASAIASGEVLNIAQKFSLQSSDLAPATLKVATLCAG
jgi:polar amino acid transport system substrate-binding protein